MVIAFQLVRQQVQTGLESALHGPTLASLNSNSAVHSQLKQRVCECIGDVPVIEGSNAQAANVELAGVAPPLVAGHLQMSGAMAACLMPSVKLLPCCSKAGASLQKAVK